MQEIELEVLWHTDETKLMDDCGMDYDLDEVERRNLTFYGISHIKPNHWDDEHDFTTIYALCGEKYISPLKYDDLKKEIHEKIKQ